MTTEITDLLILSKKNGASDLHLSSGFPPAMRKHGEVTPITNEPLKAEEVKSMLYAVMTEAQRAEYERDFEIDFAIQFGKELRFRVNAFNTMNGPAAVFRSIPTEILTMEQLNLPDAVKKLCYKTQGLILVTGPTGSGKSTTLAAMIDHINRNCAKHILTIEDPVEFVHKSQRSLMNQRELGSQTHSFARALKSALREDPDVILVGEMRDLETIQLALSAAETGHLVVGTLHTNSAAKTIDRIIDVFPAGDKPLIVSMLSTSIEGVICQRLLRTADGKGRVAALEILLGTPAIRNLIREGKLPQIYSMMQVGSKVGMTTMKDSVYKLLHEGVIDLEAAKSCLNVGGEDESNETSNEMQKAANAQQAQQSTMYQQRPSAGGGGGGSFGGKDSGF